MGWWQGPKPLSHPLLPSQMCWQGAVSWIRSRAFDTPIRNPRVTSRGLPRCATTLPQCTCSFRGQRLAPQHTGLDYTEAGSSFKITGRHPHLHLRSQAKELVSRREDVPGHSSDTACKGEGWILANTPSELAAGSLWKASCNLQSQLH